MVEGNVKETKLAEVQDSNGLLKNFKYEHLPPKLQSISKPFHELALKLIAILPPNEERHFMLRKLVEAKDCAVRSGL